MATAAKSYKSVVEKYDAETAVKWRPATKEELSALRAAALDPENRIKMNRFDEPATVQQVIDILSGLPKDAKVLVSEHDGNWLAALFDISEARTVSDFRCNQPDKIAPDAIVVTLYPRER